MKRNWERGTQVLPLDLAALTVFIQPAFPGRRVESAHPIASGLSNTNYQLKISGCEAPVRLRLFTARPECSRLETAVSRLVRQKVPVSECIFESDSNPINGHPYALFEWIDGSMMDTALAAAGAEVVASLAQQAGGLLAIIGSFTFPSAGFLDCTLRVAQPLRLSSETFKSYIHHDLFDGRAGDRLGNDLSAILWRFVTTTAPLLDDLEASPRLVHGDFDGSNILVRRVDTGWKICGVIDWEYALSATPLVDIGHVLRPPFGDDPVFERNVVESFLANGGTLPSNWKRASRLLDLLNWVGFPARPAAGPNVIASCREMILRTMREW